MRETFTAAPREGMRVCRDRWRAIGLSTAPADRPRAEQGIRMAYAAGHRVPPERIVWCESPMHLAVTRARMLGQLTHGEAGAPVGGSLWEGSLTSVAAAVGAAVQEADWDEVWAAVGVPVREVVWAARGARLLESVVATGLVSVRETGRGQHDAAWLGFYQYWHDVGGLVEETRALRGQWEVAAAAGWWLPHERICWVSERPDRGLRYPDGWGIAEAHGGGHDHSRDRQRHCGAA